MACAMLYDFINEKTIRLPAGPHTGADIGADGRHGVRPILTPTESARSLLHEHARLLAELTRGR